MGRRVTSPGRPWAAWPAEGPGPGRGCCRVGAHGCVAASQAAALAWTRPGASSIPVLLLSGGPLVCPQPRLRRAAQGCMRTCLVRHASCGGAAPRTSRRSLSSHAPTRTRACLSSRPSRRPMVAATCARRGRQVRRDGAAPSRARAQQVAHAPLWQRQGGERPPVILSARCCSPAGPTAGGQRRTRRNASSSAREAS